MRTLSRFFLVFLALSAPAFSQQNTIYNAPCAFSYFYDSYGLGIQHGLLGTDMGTNRKWIDAGCLQWGINEGARLRAKYCDKNSDCEKSRCGRDFKEGYREGFKASGTIIANDCTSQGYISGRADLDLGAREKNKSLVGRACVDAYFRGVKDGKNLIASTPPSDQPQRSCYELGYYEHSYY